MAIARSHILVVDDLNDAADSMVDLLSIWGYDATACYDGATALKLVRIKQPTLILLDLAMPEMDGFQFTQLLHELPNCELVPLIALSGHSSQTYRARAWEIGIRHFLLKPADPKCLKDLLAQELEFALSPAPLAEIFDSNVSVELSQPGRRKLGGLYSKAYWDRLGKDESEHDEASRISPCL
jgi:CheY-like chemotaxis protein